MHVACMNEYCDDQLELEGMEAPLAKKGDMGWPELNLLSSSRNLP